MSTTLARTPLGSGPTSGTDASTGPAHMLSALEGARMMLRSVPEVLAAASEKELTGLLTVLDQTASLAAAGRVAVTAEAMGRGQVAASRSASATAWVAEHAPATRGGGAAAVAKVAAVLAGESSAGVPTGPNGEGMQAGAREMLREAVLGGSVAPQTALSVVAEYTRLRSRLTDEAAPTVLDAMLTMGAAEGSRGVVKIAPQLMRRYGAPGDLQAEQDAAAERVALSHARPEAGGVCRYELTVHAEGKAVLEAAIGPLSAPATGPDGDRDHRTPEQRRGHALLDVVRRVTAAAAAAPVAASGLGAGAAPSEPAAAPDARGSPTTAESEANGPDGRSRGPAVGGVKATLLVTMSLHDLQQRVGAAETLGPAGTGTVLAPETARRIACDAGVVPAVLGSRGEVLDLGTKVRFFTPGQARALWLRDGGCTFPGCDRPPFWTDAHHLIHWADGGPSDLSNAALLCGRHHTVVHRDLLAGRVGPDGVTWDLQHGSYGRAGHATDRGGGASSPEP